jgi:3-dehydroquinate synthase
VLDHLADGTHVAFDEAGRACSTFASPSATASTVELYEVLAEIVAADLEDADEVVAIAQSITVGIGVRQTISCRIPCTIVDLGAALAELVPSNVDRFVYVSRAWSEIALVTLDASRAIVHVDRAQGSRFAARDLALAIGLGYRFIIFESTLDTCDLGASTSILDRARLRDVARVVSRRKQTAPGVWIRDCGSGTMLTMSLERRITYDILQSRDPIFSPGNSELARALGGRDALFVIDEAVDVMYGAELRTYAERQVIRASFATVRGVEHEKTLENARRICRFAVAASLPRDGVFVGVGGGVTLDLVGMAAAMHRRGTAYIRIATTLVGMIDVCVGVKQGVNDGGNKNILGSYYAPQWGFNDARFLATLPKVEIAAGLAEILKVALVLDGHLFRLLEEHVEEFFADPFEQTPAVVDIIVRAKARMMRELQRNLWEEDLRRFVDFGHTFSSKIESSSDYGVSHGIAVALDMGISTAVAVGRGLCDPAILERLRSLYRRVDLPLVHEACSLDVLLSSLAPMRLHRAGNLNLVVPTGVGSSTFLQDVSRHELARALRLIADAEQMPVFA